MSTIFDKSRIGKNKYAVPGYGLSSSGDIPPSFLRSHVDLPDVNETEMVRHYTGLSTLNFGVDTGMYPLGSCTMKYNPKVNEKLASMESFTSLHPMIDCCYSQGALQIMHELTEYLCSITGMDSFSLAPAAGAHGELTAVMMIKKYFQEKGENRPVILIPDSAHGTNPASVAMCGFEIKTVHSNPEGDVDIESLKSLLDENVAAMMLTSPSTLGLFDRHLTQVSRLLHDNGSLFYCDGANLNAVMGVAKIKDMGFDIMHVNLHKTFSTPHGGGGPGSGPVGVVSKLVPYLPVPAVVKQGNEYMLNYENKRSIGRVHSFYGNFLIMLRAFIYIRMMGEKGIRGVSEHAVLNANYLMARLKSEYHLPYKRICMHEFVLSDRDLPNHVTTNDVAKRILDYGIHSPTVYFPLIVDGALMVEPTETESLEYLDDFVKVMKQIKKEAMEDPDMVKNAPHKTPLRRVDAVTAARKPVLKWEKE